MKSLILYNRMSCFRFLVCSILDMHRIWRHTFIHVFLCKKTKKSQNSCSNIRETMDPHLSFHGRWRTMKDIVTVCRYCNGNELLHQTYLKFLKELTDRWTKRVKFMNKIDVKNMVAFFIHFQVVFQTKYTTKWNNKIIIFLQCQDW